MQKVKVHFNTKGKKTKIVLCRNSIMQWNRINPSSMFLLVNNYIKRFKIAELFALCDNFVRSKMLNNTLRLVS